MSDDGHEIIYEPDEPDEDDRIEDAKKRGLGRSFFNVAEHDSVQEGFAAIEKYNNPIRTRYRGRTNRGQSSTYYWYCTFRSCGCKKEYRISTNKYDSTILEQESVGEHEWHELLQRNGGRGMSYSQVAMMDYAGRKTPKEITEIFCAKNKSILDADIYLRSAFTYSEKLFQDTQTASSSAVVDEKALMNKNEKKA